MWICTLPGFCWVDATLPAQDPESVPPRSSEPREVEALIDRAEQVLTSKLADISGILSDPNYLSAHPWPRFREIIKQHARGSRVTMVTPQKAGERMRVRIRFVEADGSASAGALVYLYHTNARGDYGPNDANVPPVGSDNNYARLFCYAVTDPAGVIEIQTIRPGGYPQSNTPEHIHLRITTRGGKSYGAEIWFDDGPRVDRKAREEAARNRIVICPVAVDAHGHRFIDAMIRLD